MESPVKEGGDLVAPAHDEPDAHPVQEPETYEQERQGIATPYDSDEEDDVDLKEFGGHKLMEGIQKLLFEQLEREYDRVSVERRELDGELKKAKDNKEQVGVELYSKQQQLARLQMALEELHNQFNTIKDARGQEESVLDECKWRHATLKETHEEKQKNLLKAQAELDALNETIMQVERYVEEMKGEIAITRRATYKAEANVQELEKQKQSQDLYIDSMNTKIKHLKDQIAMYEAQYGVQKRQTDEAKAILAETTESMELISFEKRQLVLQWKASLINLTKRDEAVAAAAKQVDQAKTEIQDMASESIGLKREIIAAQTQNESLVAVRDKLQKDGQQVEEQTSAILIERDQLAERYQMLQKSMAQTDEEEKGVNSRREELEKQVETLIQNMQVVNRERQRLELEILERENDKLTVAKAAKNYSRSMQEVRRRIHETEMEAAGIENELSRIRVDALNTEAHNLQLREMLDKHVTDLKEKDKLIEKYQLETRQRNDEIEKKMYRVDRLNRKYEQMVDAAGDDDGPLLGPLEATIKSLRKDIASTKEESEGLQKDWLADQTSIVNISAETEEVLERNKELRARIAILSEKKLRTAKELVVVEAETKRLDQSIALMHKDMAKLNEIIGRNADTQADLQHTTSIMELEFVNELKELEQESVATERRLQESRQHKAQLLDEIVEAERQLLLWEKKIQLEKETQAALDPSVGTSEIGGMEKEIHRMKLRKSTLRSERDQLMKELERAVQKREAISLRELGKKRTAKAVVGKPEMSKADLSKKMREVKRSINGTTRSTAEYIAAIQESRSNLQSLTEQLEQRTTQYGDLEEDANRLQAEINEQLYEKQRLSELFSQRQQMLKRYQALEKGKRQPVSETDKPIVEDKLSEAQQELSAARETITVLQSRFEHLDEVFGRVLRLTQEDGAAEQ